MQVRFLGGKIPWRRKWQPTPGFLPGESPRQRSLAGHGPRDRKSRTRLSTHRGDCRQVRLFNSPVVTELPPWTSPTPNSPLKARLH